MSKLQWDDQLALSKKREAEKREEEKPAIEAIEDTDRQAADDYLSLDELEGFGRGTERIPEEEGILVLSSEFSPAGISENSPKAVLENDPEYAAEMPAETGILPYDGIKAEESGDNKSLLEMLNGHTEPVGIADITINDPVKTAVNIVRKTEAGYELIGAADIPVRVIEVSDEEVLVLKAEHKVRNGSLSRAELSECYKTEKDHAETVLSLFGKAPAALNSLSEEEFCKAAELAGLDERLFVLPYEAAKEAYLLSGDEQKTLGDIIERVGKLNISAQAVESLKGKTDEKEMLIELIRCMA